MVGTNVRLARVWVAALLVWLGATVIAAAAEYELGQGDRVKVTVFGHPDLSGEFEVDGRGRLALPLIDSVRAKGLTLADLEMVITNTLKPGYLKNPRVSVEVLNYRPFYILGEVRQPGRYPYVEDMTVITAVALAGGFTYRAAEDDVMITRGKARTKGEVPADTTTSVLPGDVVRVPERFF